MPPLEGGSAVGVPSPPAILLPDGAIVTPAIEDAERLQGLSAGWTAGTTTLDGTPFRDRRRWLLVGNAVKVEVAAWVGRRLAAPGLAAVPADLPLAPGSKWPAAAWGDGRRRYGVRLGIWPVARPAPPLAAFLERPGTPLSARATRGFVTRLQRSSLRLDPAFVAAVAAHLARIDSASRAAA